MKETFCSLFFNEFIKVLKDVYQPRTEEKSKFPDMPGKVLFFYFSAHELPFTFVMHQQVSKEEFVGKLYMGHHPEGYFTKEENTLFFSEKGYRQNNPHIMKIIFHDSQKEDWYEEQIPYHNPEREKLKLLTNQIWGLLTSIEETFRKKKISAS